MTRIRAGTRGGGFGTPVRREREGSLWRHCVLPMVRPTRQRLPTPDALMNPGLRRRSAAFGLGFLTTALWALEESGTRPLECSTRRPARNLQENGQAGLDSANRRVYTYVHLLEAVRPERSHGI